MEKHFNEAELTRLVEGDFPLKGVFKKLSHIAKCQSCKSKLRDIAPSFFEDHFEPAGEPPAVENEVHFSDAEIQSFLKAEIPVSERLEMSGHFRICLFCKQKLYEADPNHLKRSVAALLSEEEENPSAFSNLYSFVPLCMASLVLACMIGLVVFSGADQSPTGLQAKKSDKADAKSELDLAAAPEPDSAHAGETKLRQSLMPRRPAAAGSEFENRKGAAHRRADSKVSAAAAAAGRQVLKSAKSAPAIKSRMIASEVRSAVGAQSRAAAGAGAAGELALSPYFETVAETRPKFRWKSVQNAVKYNFYLSDTSQVLIEEFESATSTSYSPKKELESNKTYKWKVIATLKDGSAVQSRPVLFSVGEKNKREDSAIKNKTRLVAAAELKK